MRHTLLLAAVLAITLIPVRAQGPTGPVALPQRIVHTDPAAFRSSPAVHGGAGTMSFTALLNRGAVTPEFNFLHRGVIPAGAGIGHHFHNVVEEMFVILDGEAQFTVDGRTSVLKGPAGAPVRMGHSHAIYNHTDPAKYRPSPAVHGGPGQLNYTGLLDHTSLDTNLFFLHRGIIQPKSGIGAHFHNQCEEMFVIFDGEAQFTVDGRTSVLKGPAGAPVRMGHSHAIYNPTDKPIQWMNINVSARKGVYDAFDLTDGRVGAALDPIPTFMTMRLDQALLRPAAGPAPTAAKGTVQYRRALPPSVFLGPWAYVDHVVLAPGSATAPQAYQEIGEF